MRSSLLAHAIVAVLCTASLTGCTGHEPQRVVTHQRGSTEASSATEPERVARDALTVDEALAETLVDRPGDRVLVVSDDGRNTIGYVNYEAFSRAGADAPPVNPVYAQGGPSGESGIIIAFWGRGIGWIPPAVYHSPSFDYDALVSEGQAGLDAPAEE